MPHLAQLLLDYRLTGRPDRLRAKRPFSEEMAATHAVLFNPDFTKYRKVKAYRRWIESGQPCVFGRVAAKNQNVFICLLEEHEILRMRRGDDDLRDTIQDYRQVWKRYALDGLSSSFVVLLVSRGLTEKEPGPELKAICRRLMELYMEIPRIDDDSYHTQREYVFLRGIAGDPNRLLKFSTLPNVFCAQGDGRWWQDHRTPGGIMITSNALGHFVYARTATRAIGEKEVLQALDNAMRTIGNAFRPARKNSGLKHSPATWLVPPAPTEMSPLKSDMRKWSPDHYAGYFHTDHLIPSVFFRPERDPADLHVYDHLEFRYIFDPKADEQGHAELMTGLDATWYDVRRNLDRLPDFANPESSSELSDKQRGQLLQWAERRLTERLS